MARIRKERKRAKKRRKLKLRKLSHPELFHLTFSTAMTWFQRSKLSWVFLTNWQWVKLERDGAL
jgi:hypothetical protein